jgi:arylsulfatase A-like enzyme
MRPLLIFIFTIIACLAHAQQRPNIILMVADDLGYGDIGCYGNTSIPTPNLDALAARSIQYMQAYAAAPVCTPSRTGLMTGRYPARTAVGLREPLDWNHEDSLMGLDPSIPNLAKGLHDAGYATHLVGKWHLGFTPAFHPMQLGFDHFYGIKGGANDYQTHQSPDGSMDLYDGYEVSRDEGYMTDLLLRRSVEIIQRPHQKPFFLSLQFTAPHWPWQAPADPAYPLDDAAWKKNGSAEKFASMVSRMDSAVGVILQTLQANGMMNNTIIVFTSDNGGERYSDMGILRDKKMTLWEGGIRVPMLVCWPAVVKPKIENQAVSHLDLTVSFLDVAGVKDQRALDGISLWTHWKGAALPADRVFFWRLFQRAQYKAVRKGQWKYLEKGADAFLFRIDEDPSEKYNLVLTEPGKQKELKKMMEAWEAEMLVPVPLPAGK